MVPLELPIESSFSVRLSTVPSEVEVEEFLRACGVEAEINMSYSITNNNNIQRFTFSTGNNNSICIADERHWRDLLKSLAPYC